MAKRVADLVVDVLVEAGVERVYGVSGDSLNGITDSIRTLRNIQWVHVRHEEVAAFAAGAVAHLTGKLAVCAGWPSQWCSGAARTLGGNLLALKDPSESLLPPLTEIRTVAAEVAFAAGIEAQKDGVAPKVSEDELHQRVLVTQ